MISPPPNNLEHVKNFLPSQVRLLIPVEHRLEVLVEAVISRKLPKVPRRRQPQPALAKAATINANVETGDGLTADRARLGSRHEFLRAVSANHGVAAGAHLSVGDVHEADGALILVFLLFVDRAFEGSRRSGRNGRRDFLLRSDVDLLVPLPVVCLVLLGAVPGFEATGAGLRGRDLAVRKGVVGSAMGMMLVMR